MFSLAIMCKSGKDRTSQLVTLEEASAVAPELNAGLANALREVGTRRENVKKNTGKSFYAFSKGQWAQLPHALRPPIACCSGGVVD